MRHNLGRSAVFSLVNNPVANASTTLGSATWVDCANYEGCLFLMTCGTISTGATFTVNYAASTTGSGTAVSGASVSIAGSADDNKIAAIDVYSPHSKGRYLRPILTKAGASAFDFGGFVAIRYNGRKAPYSSTGLVDGNVDLVVVQTT